MADPTRLDPSHKKLTQPGSKFFDPDPSLNSTILHALEIHHLQSEAFKFHCNEAHHFFIVLKIVL